MLKSYFTIAWRNIQRNPGYTFINIAGLAFSLAVFIAALLYVNYETGFDRWSDQLKQVYRLNITETRQGEPRQSIYTPYSVGTQLAATCPEIKNVTHIVEQQGERLVSTNDKKLYIGQVMSADSSFFNVFPFGFVYGSAATALQHPNQAVLSEETSRKLFGDGNPVGKTFTFNAGKIYTVTGVYKKNGPSHLDFNICLSYFNTDPGNWGRQFFYTYLSLNPHTSIATLPVKAKAIVERGEAAYSFSNSDGHENGTAPSPAQAADWLANKAHLSVDAVGFENVADIHLHSNISPYRDVAYGKAALSHQLINSQTGAYKTVWFLSLSAFLVLLLACINYTNLSIARSGKRARESGVRKVMGASRSQLMKQFLSEAFVQTLFALLVALFVANLFIHIVNNSFQTQLSLFGGSAEQNTTIVAQLALVLAAVVLLSGAYPAFVLSSFKPVKVLKGDITQNVKGKFLRNGLVVLQFAVSACFIIGMIVVYRQLNFINTTDPGFSTDQVLVLKPHNDDMLSAFSTENKMELIKHQLLNVPGVKSVAFTDAFPGQPSIDQQEAEYDGHNSQMTFNYVGFDYFKSLNMKLNAGRDFSPAFTSDTVDNAIINQTAARAMGLQNPIGHSVKILLRNYHIIGVLKDNHVAGYNVKISPEIYAIGVSRGPNLSYQAIMVKVNGRNAEAVTKAVNAYWKTLEPDFPLRYSWLDEEFARLFERYQRFGKMTALLSTISIVISLMGIFALSAFAAAQRTKEIGIRKVFGASVIKISRMLSLDFVRLVGLSLLIAFPLAYWASAKWLQEFAYRIELSWAIFAAAGASVLFIALATISFQTVKAAIANPVDSLRNE